ncbi:ferritin-like domain-containing protein [Chloroflexota bacterium]
MKGKKPVKSVQLVDLLNQALKLEYSIIIHLPRIVSSITDKKAKEMALLLVNTSMKHADIVASTINTLGGTPEWAFEPAPVGTDMVEILKQQLDRETLARQLHRDSASLIQDWKLRLKFDQLAKDHDRHIQMINNILERLR